MQKGDKICESYVSSNTNADIVFKKITPLLAVHEFKITLTMKPDKKPYTVLREIYKRFDKNLKCIFALHLEKCGNSMSE